MYLKHITFIGDLCNENDEIPNGSCNTPNNKRKSENGKSNAIYEHHHHHHHHQQHDENTAESCPVNTATKLMMAPLCVSKKDRNKFCGSLPNHLDADDVCGENGMLFSRNFFSTSSVRNIKYFSHKNSDIE